MKSDRGEKSPKRRHFFKKSAEIYNISLLKILLKYIFHKNIAQLEVVIDFIFKKNNNVQKEIEAKNLPKFLVILTIANRY